MSNIFDNDKPVYWDDGRLQFYWIEWIETGNNDIPIRHYINFNIKEKIEKNEKK